MPQTISLWPNKKKALSLSHIHCCSLFAVKTVVSSAVAAPTDCTSRNKFNCNYIVLSEA